MAGKISTVSVSGRSVASDSTRHAVLLFEAPTTRAGKLLSWAITTGGSSQSTGTMIATMEIYMTAATTFYSLQGIDAGFDLYKNYHLEPGENSNPIRVGAGYASPAGGAVGTIVSAVADSAIIHTKSAYKSMPPMGHEIIIPGGYTAAIILKNSSGASIKYTAKMDIET